MVRRTWSSGRPGRRHSRHRYCQSPDHSSYRTVTIAIDLRRVDDQRAVVVRIWNAIVIGVDADDVGDGIGVGRRDAWESISILHIDDTAAR